MKIYINGKYLIARMTGVQRVALEIVRAMEEQIRAGALDVQLTVLTPPRWIARSRLRPLFALLWEQFVLPFLAHDGLLLSLCNTGPVLKQQHAIVLHDTAVFDMPENYGTRYVRIQRMLMRLHARRALRILTVSQFSRSRLAFHLGLAESSITLLGVGVEHVMRISAHKEVLTRLGLVECGYLLAVGSRQPGKNFPALLEAARIAKLKLPIVIVGGADKHVFGYGELLQSGHLIDAGYVGDDELVALLSHARCYLQPSLYEGFGLPVIEAMALGVPVLCSRAASLPEVCGDAADFFDPRNTTDMANTLSAFLADPSRYAELRNAGLARVKRHSWHKAAKQLLADLSNP